VRSGKVAFTIRKTCAPERGGLFYEENRYTLDSQGIRVNRPGIDAVTRWSVVRSVTSTAEYLYLRIDRMQAHMIPRRAVSTGISPDDLLAAVERWRSESNRDAVLANPGFSEPGSAVPVSSAARNPESRGLVSGLPRLLALRTAPGMNEVPVWLVWLLAGLTLMCWAGLDWLRTEPNAIFISFGASGVAWYVLILLAVAATLSSQSRPRVSLRSTLVLLLTLVLVLFALAALATVLSAPKAIVMAGGMAAGIYGIALASRLLSSITGRIQLRAVTSAVLVLGFSSLLTACIYVDPGLWYSPDVDEHADYSDYWDQDESLLLEQPGRIDAAIAKVAQPDEESPAAFFVGFAGYGEERVFAEEIKLASHVLGERYGSSDRSVLLLNDRRNMDSQPIATASSLRYTLRKLAAKMDVAEDILFLSLSSHGSEDSLSVSNQPLILKDLTDEELAAALHDSGIKWRVIVISACYSGSFIDALRDSNTIVITAAAADRTSFGCSDSRDLTYFGEAFYRDALPEASSLREAFEMAVDALAKRERKEDIKASNPQAHFGDAIERRLELLERS